MIGEFPHYQPTVQIPSQWDPFEDPTVEINSISSFPFGSPDCNNNPFTIQDSFGSLKRFLPSNDPDDISLSDEFPDLPLDAFTCDNFRTYDFKVRRCARGRSHDWTECPFAHPGEKARRRDPRKYNYSGTACPEFRKGACRRGDSCEFAHGVFECWLHPDRYRTQGCKDGMGCRRRICFFAHSPDQLRVMNLPSPGRSSLNLNSLSSISNSADTYDGSPLRRSFDSYQCNNRSSANSNAVSFDVFASSSPTTSPPSSPLSSSFNELIYNIRNLQLAKARLSPTSAWGFPGSVGSPRSGSSLRPGFGSVSVPTTPTRMATRSWLAQFDKSELNSNQEEPVLERVESGRDLRAKLYAKLSKENTFGAPGSEYGYQLADPDLDVGWISDMIQ